MSTDTPETDEALSTAECESDLVIRMRRMERERDEAREYADRLDVSGIHSCHSECQQSNCVLRRELTAVTEQRDRYKLACDQYSEDEILCKLQTVTAQRDEAVNNYESAQLLAIRVGEHRDRLAEEVGQLKSRLTQTMGAVTISRNGYVQELEQQRDRLAEALLALRNNESLSIGGAAYEIIEQALQSLTSQP
jgi:uncharacterized coiled-coil DUF342 family protein